MLRKPITDEWTKYFINGAECKREALYQIILDYELYTAKITIEKKHHFEQKKIWDNEETIESNNRNSSISIDTTQFIKKFDPTSKEYKLLIEKIIHSVDMFYEAMENYCKNSKKLRAAILDCYSLLTENIHNTKDSYASIMQELTLELVAFFFDMMAFVSSQPKQNKKLPSLVFDTKSIKEKWSDDWNLEKKSEFLKDYLSIILKQADIVHQNWKKSHILKDKSTRKEFQNKFDEFKKITKNLQKQKASLDCSLRGKTRFKFSSFLPLHQKKSYTQLVEDDPKHTATPNINF